MENHIVFDCLSRLLATKRHDFYLPIPAVNLSIPVEITTNPPNKLRRLEIHPQTTRGIPPTTRHARFIRDNNLTSVCHQYCFLSRFGFFPRLLKRFPSMV